VQISTHGRERKSARIARTHRPKSSIAHWMCGTPHGSAHGVVRPCRNRHGPAHGVVRPCRTPHGPAHGVIRPCRIPHGSSHGVVRPCGTSHGPPTRVGAPSSRPFALKRWEKGAGAGRQDDWTGGFRGKGGRPPYPAPVLRGRQCRRRIVRCGRFRLPQDPPARLVLRRLPKRLRKPVGRRAIN
jgi:hypothetical protein